ncbi:MAG: M56 family metallopeptidase [Lachnospiraceae bacterium]|nr:M56 family metallopeptidase [Lachnospiraceae bacterium]
METILLKVLNMSITAGWLILAVLCIRLVFKKLPKWVNCLLWGAAAFRLICPFSIESPFSLLPSAEPIKSRTIVEGQVRRIPSIDSRLTIVRNTINPMLTESFAYDERAGAAPMQTVTYIAGMIWILGMILLIICGAVSLLRLHMLVREAVCLRENIYICDAVKSPFAAGIVRPRIYLPSSLDEKEMNYIIAHEKAHLKRKDHWWKLLGYLLLSVHWFNPLCWAGYALFCKDVELACDEKVVKGMTFSEKKEYSKVLLSCARQRSLITAFPPAFGEAGVRERVKSVLNYKKPALWVVTAAAVICVVTAICFLTNPAREYQIKITIPAGSTAPLCYSDEEISPKGNALTFYAGEGLGDTAIELLPVEVREENAYDEPVYITPGMPAKVNAEKGAWFKIGVYMQNPTDEDKVVYVSVKNVTVRIASSENESESGSENVLENGQEDGSENELENGQEDTALLYTYEKNQAEADSVSGIVLYEQPEADKVCVRVQPSMIREQPFYYYIPTDRDQEWLSVRVEALDLEGEPWDRRWEGRKENGWQIIYQDKEIRSFEGGYLYYTYEDEEKGLMECMIEDPKLCDYIQIMLIEKAGYQTYDVSDIKDVVSAKLDVNSPFTGGKRYSQTITDAKTLQVFENWFRNAEYTVPGTECGNQYACLELTLANGEVVKLSMASDDCPNFYIDGTAYDYRPVSDWNNREFYSYFDEIPWE